MKVWTNLGMALIVVLCLGGGGCRPAPPRWITQPIQRGEVVQVVNATGTLQPVVLSPVGSQVSGIVWKILADYNDLVKRGQVLVELDPALFQSAVAQQEANVAAAEADVLKARAALQDAKLIADRSVALADKHYIAAADRDTAVAKQHEAAADLAGSQARVLQARAALKKARLDLQNSVVLSPVDGTVIARNVELGQAVVASFQAPNLFTIAQDLKKMQVLANVDEADIGMVQIGQTAEFTVDAYRGRRFTAKVSQVRDAAQTVQNVVTYVVVLDVDNSDLLLKPGMTANVRVEVARRQGVLLLPNAALRFKPPVEAIKGKDAAKDVAKEGHGKGDRGQERGPKGPGRPGGGKGEAFVTKGTVYVQDGQALRGAPVRIGITDGLQTELLHGLEEGQQVVVDAARQGAPQGGGPSGKPGGAGPEQQRGAFRRGGF